MWVNCAYQVPFNASSNISMRQAKKLADELTRINSNLQDSGYPIIKWEEPVIAGEKRSFPFADFHILSPTEYIKDLNDTNYSKEIANISKKENRQQEAIKT